MRTYELALVFDPSLEVEQIEGELRRLNDQIVATGLVRRWERWGKRRLAYEIKGRQYGYYVIGVFDLDALQVAELSRGIRINPVVMRYLISIVDPRRVPEVDAESVRTLGAGPEVREPQMVVDTEEAVVDEIPVSDEIESEIAAPESQPEENR